MANCINQERLLPHTEQCDYCITVSQTGRASHLCSDSFAGKVFISDGQSVFGFTPGACVIYGRCGSIQVAALPGILSPMVDALMDRCICFQGTIWQTRIRSFHRCPQLSLRHVNMLYVHLSTVNIFWMVFSTTSIFQQRSQSTGRTLYACGTQAGSNAKPALYAMSLRSKWSNQHRACMGT